MELRAAKSVAPAAFAAPTTSPSNVAAQVMMSISDGVSATA